MIVRFEHLGAAPAQVMDQSLQGALPLSRGSEQLAEFLHAIRRAQMADGVRRDKWKRWANAITSVRSRLEMPLGFVQQLFEDNREP